MSALLLLPLVGFFVFMIVDGVKLRRKENRLTRRLERLVEKDKRRRERAKLLRGDFDRR